MMCDPRCVLYGLVASTDVLLDVLRRCGYELVESPRWSSGHTNYTTIKQHDDHTPRTFFCGRTCVSLGHDNPQHLSYIIRLSGWKRSVS